MRFRILDFTFALIQDRLSKCIQACVSFPPIPGISKIEYITHLKFTRNLNLTRSRSNIDFYTESLISARQSSYVAVALLKVKLRVWDFEYTERYFPLTKLNVGKLSLHGPEPIPSTWLRYPDYHWTAYGQESRILINA